MPERWEDVNENTSRLKVPGGWLYRVVPLEESPAREIPDEPNEYLTPALCFVPGPRAR